MAELVIGSRRWKTIDGSSSTLLDRIKQLNDAGYEYKGAANLIVIGAKDEVAPIPTPTPTPTPTPDPTPTPTPTPDPTPSPSPSPVPLVFGNGWDDASMPLGDGMMTLLDNGRWSDFGPSYHTPYQIAEVVSRNGSRMLQINFLPGAGGNGPDYRIIRNFGQNFSQLFASWEQEWSPSFRWASADHKLAILGAGNGDSQDVYFNIRGNSGGTSGRPVIYVTRLDTMFSDRSVSIVPGVKTVFEIKIINGQRIEAKVNGRLLNLTPEAGSGTAPIAGSGGTGFIKLDTTYNAYSYIEGIPGALPARTWYDDIRVSTVGWTR